MKIEVYSPTIRRREMDAVLTAMVEEKIGPGERNRLLIQTAKDQLHFDFALALRSPAVALQFALQSLGVKNGQAVIISALSPRYYLQVLQDLQLVPLLCDVNFDFPCMTKDTVENAISKKPFDLEVSAVILHHTLGFVPDCASITELGFPVIEDISQSYGSWMKPSAKKNDSDIDNSDNKVNPSGSSLSGHQPSLHGVLHILGLEERDMLTSGGGALLFAMNKKEASLLRGFNGIADEYCLADINAALAVVQFKEIQRNIERRNEISAMYKQACLSLASRTKHRCFITDSESFNNYFSFSLILETGLKDVISYAKKKEILLDNAFDKTIAGAGVCENCPVSNSLAMRTILLPLYPRLRSGDVERVSRLIMTLP
ncbi:MAG: DegT/DnrJ/EryC1/StrS family aminotransferase [Treponema sp.]|nr:DegT/DnrJ/EryC1/StrS family aminotransferase [Treponema sp.]MCL2272206.1 DegT/DnrJ/EryC1/StrS family aminotransferase [Treponema sp.]